MIKERLSDYILNAIKENWDLPSMGNYGTDSKITFADVGNRILDMHAKFKVLGIHKGDKIAVCGVNSVNWAITYLSIVSYGAVVVPILPDFSSDDIVTIITESGSKHIFADSSILDRISSQNIKSISHAFLLSNFESRIGSTDITKTLIENVSKEDFKLFSEGNETLATIIYTSGTTGFSKGVMLNHNALAVNIRYAQQNIKLESGNTVLSFLPLAHVFGCLFDFLYPFSKGTSINFLTQLPTPQVLLKALDEIKPHLILMVPLILEKVYLKQVVPIIEKPLMKILLKLPVLSSVIKKKICKKLETAFGGRFYAVIVGGSALNSEAEKFFIDIGFRLTVGYGMTECAPLISYNPPDKHLARCCGKIIDTLEIKIDSEDEKNKPGEIMVRGENVMLGYYKNPKATAEVLSKDGWLRTGDLGVVDENKNIFIRGRSKNMLLGASGQNIYPEEIESRINNMPYILESLVVQRGERLYAIIHPDMEKVRLEKMSLEELSNKFDAMRIQLNTHLPTFASITGVTIQEIEFEKNATKKIKRFLYK